VSSLPFRFEQFPAWPLAQPAGNHSKRFPQFPLCLPTLAWDGERNNGGVYSIVGLVYPAGVQLLKSPRLHFYFGCFMEAALLGVAALLGWLFDYRLFQDLGWCLGDAAWGVVATAPMLLGFWWMLRSSSNYAAGIRRFLEHVIRPMFGGWSVVQLAVISLLAGLCEEVLFRGALQGGLTDVTGKWGALAVSSIAFGLAHPVSKQYIMAAGVIGFYLGVLFIVTGNLLVPIVAHGVYDFCALMWFLRWHRSDPR
jgi:uncharacterized protein